MFRFSLGQLRSSLRHSGAMALAIIVATAFIVAALAGSAVMRRTMLNIVSEQYGSADLVVSLGLLGEGTQVPLSAQDDAAQVPGVAAAFLPVAVSGVITTSTDATEWTLVRSLSTNPQLSGWPVAAGREPATGGEVSLATSLANRCDIALGDTVSLTVNLYREEKAVAEAEAAAAGEGTDPAGPLDAGEADGTASGEGTGAAGPRDAGEGSVLSDESVATGYDGGVVEATVQLTVTGLFDDSLPSFWDRPAAQVLPETLAQLGVFADSVAPPQVGELLIAVEPGQDPAKLAPQVAAGLAAAWDAQAPALGCADGIVAGEGYCRVGAQTTAAATSQAAAYYLEQADAVTAVGLVAAAVSLLVAFLVIANTFQVMLAGRIRALGLLRAVGATRQQVRGTVLTEALVMGVGAAAVGVGAGWALIAGAIWAAHEMYPAIPLPPSVEMAPWVAGLALVV
ncbi:MAG: ABC transporter permease, partial [Bifidobacteriaceae bacterium]|nr:ABC transporter permease [Bifidobacteriaceae bacterium]